MDTKWNIVEFNKKYEELKNQVSQEMKVVENNLGVALNPSILQNLQVDTTQKVNIVFVGQYSAGKSSIIKMLTHDADIQIGAGITTQSYTPYEWQNLEIVDTPGIQTGLREDHDAITDKAIRKADLLVFVTTPGSMNPTLLHYFNKLAYDMGKADQMILVVNKMNSAGKSDVLYQDLQEILAQPYGTYPMKPLESFRPSFISAGLYLDAQEEDDKEFYDEMYQKSGYEQFVKTLDDFARDKGLLGKLRTPVRQLEDMLDQLYQIVVSADQGQSENVEQELLQQVFSIEAEYKKLNRFLEDELSAATTRIQQIGNDLANDYTVETTANDWEVLVQKAGDKEKEIKEALNASIQDACQNLNREIEEALQHISKKIVADHLPGTGTESADVARATLESMQLLKHNSDSVLKGIGEFVYSNKTFFKGRAVQRFVTANSTKFSAALGALTQVVGKIYAEHQLQEAKEKRQVIRKAYQDEAELLRKTVHEGVLKPLKNGVNDKVSELKKEISLNQLKDKETKRMTENIASLTDECQKLMDSLD